MSEVLSIEFKFNASTQRGSLLTTLDAVGEFVDAATGETRTRTLIGPTPPAAEYDLGTREEDAREANDAEALEHIANFRAFLAWLEPDARAVADAAVADPAALRTEASRIARDRQALAAELAALEAKRRELASLEK